MATLTPQQNSEIARQVRAKLGKNPALTAMSASKREELLRHTADVVAAMAAPSTSKRAGDAYALDDNSGAATTAAQRQTPLGEGVRTGVTEAARMVKEINFPSFVASLIEGTFH